MRLPRSSALSISHYYSFAQARMLPINLIALILSYSIFSSYNVITTFLSRCWTKAQYEKKKAEGKVYS